MKILGGKQIEQDAERLSVLMNGQYGKYSLICLTSPLTSSSFNGNAFSTTAKTLIDLSSVFGVPDKVSAVLIALAIRDSGSAAGDYYVVLGPTDAGNTGMSANCQTINDRWNRASFIVPCDANGDIYYQIAASGASTFDFFLNIWGYFL